MTTGLRPHTGLLLRILGFLVLFAFFTSPGFAMPSHVLLIRHGEKPDDDSADLSKRGWERAAALPKIFMRSPLKELGAPVGLIGMVPDHKKGSRRALQTLQFVSNKFQIEINDNFTRDEVDEVVHFVETNPAFDNRLVVLCWEHKVLRDVAKAFGWDKPPKWPSEQYDRSWLLNFEHNTLTSVQDLPQILLPGDSNQ